MAGFPVAFVLTRIAPALLVLAAPAAFAAEQTHVDFRNEARAAYQRKNYAEAQAATLSALTLRPDSALYLQNLAALSALTGEPKAAIAYLERLAGLGVAPPLERDPDFAALQGTPEFARVLRSLAENRVPAGQADVIAELPGRTGILEGIAYRGRTGDLFFSDVHHRCIWRRDRTGQIVRFSEEDDEVLAVFGLAVDEPRNTLWAALSAVPEMAGFTSELKGRAALASFHLGTSELQRVVHLPGDGRDHGLGDLVVDVDGTVYATDSKAPVIWKLSPDSEEFEKVVESPLFQSLQGVVLDGRVLLVADYANGLFAVDVASGAITPLAPPPNVTLLGLDGLVAIPGGVVAVQNGTEPQRVLRISLAPGSTRITKVTVLASALPHLTDLSLVTLVNDQPAVLAGTGWDVFNPARDKQPPPHTVRVLQVALPVE